MPKGVTREAYVDAMKKLNEIGREFKEKQISFDKKGCKSKSDLLYDLQPDFYIVSI